MTDEPDPPPTNDFAETAVSRPAFEFDEATGELIGTAPSAPAAPPQPVQQGEGPAWAGTLPGTDPVPAPPAPRAQPNVVPPAPPVQLPPPVAPEDPLDLAETSLHRPVYEGPVSAEPAIDDLKKLEELERLRADRRDAPTSGLDDTTLKVILGVAIALTVLLLLVLVIGVLLLAV